MMRAEVVQAAWGLLVPLRKKNKSLILYAEGLKELLTLWNVFESKVPFMENGNFFAISQDLIPHVFFCGQLSLIWTGA